MLEPVGVCVRARVYVCVYECVCHSNVEQQRPKRPPMLRASRLAQRLEKLSLRHPHAAAAEGFIREGWMGRRNRRYWSKREGGGGGKWEGGKVKG